MRESVKLSAHQVQTFCAESLVLSRIFDYQRVTKLIFLPFWSSSFNNSVRKQPKERKGEAVKIFIHADYRTSGSGQEY